MIYLPFQLFPAAKDLGIYKYIILNASSLNPSFDKKKSKNIYLTCRLFHEHTRIFTRAIQTIKQTWQQGLKQEAAFSCLLISFSGVDKIHLFLVRIKNYVYDSSYWFDVNRASPLPKSGAHLSTKLWLTLYSLNLDHNCGRSQYLYSTKTKLNVLQNDL